MFIVTWLKGPNATNGYVASDGNGKNKEFSTVAEAQKHVEGTIATNKMANYDALIVDTDQHSIAAWTAALPPSLQWNTATVAPATTK
jgi:hypothetical protein